MAVSDGNNKLIVQHLLPRLGDHWNYEKGKSEKKFWSHFNFFIPNFPHDHQSYQPVITAERAAKSVEKDGSWVERTAVLKFADAVHNAVHTRLGKFAPGNPVCPSDRPWVAMGKQRPPERTF